MAEKTNRIVLNSRATFEEVAKYVGRHATISKSGSLFTGRIAVVGATNDDLIFVGIESPINGSPINGLSSLISWEINAFKKYELKGPPDHHAVWVRLGLPFNSIEIHKPK